jgi:hypothetical protein
MLRFSTIAVLAVLAAATAARAGLLDNGSHLACIRGSTCTRPPSRPKPLNHGAEGLIPEFVLFSRVAKPPLVTRVAKPFGIMPCQPS